MTSEQEIKARLAVESVSVVGPGRGSPAPIWHIRQDYRRGAGMGWAEALGSSIGMFRDWVALTKPRIVLLVTFTALVGLVGAPGHLSLLRAVLALLAIAVSAAAGGVINMWYDHDIDALMTRTRRRPIPAGRITRTGALAFGIALSLSSVITMMIACNMVAATLDAVAIGFYVFIYTMWLKRRTPYNIVIGGAAGAFPPIIGWAAVTGSIAVAPLLLFAIIFLWTPPHFWSLALWSSEDYRRARIPMLPVTAGPRATAGQIARYSRLLVVASLLPCACGISGPIYGIPASFLGIGMLVLAGRIIADPRNDAGHSLTNNAPARASFQYSILYLFALFGAFALDHCI